MGRETKLLLALLATLAGVFFGVLSMKLLMPRPPAGAGPDVTLDGADTAANELVEPPSLSPPAPGPSTDLPESIAEAAPAFEAPRNTSRFQADVQADAPVLPPAEPTAPFPARRDPFVAPAGLDMPVRQAAPPTEPAPDGAAHVASAGDSWWGLAERAYGDGRLYRALFAWNRSIDPRISLAPGTRLEIPPRSKLEAAWPKLMPAE
ncbi:MAG: LysM peptidoglycan-binding domain-containing protein [Planctomycetia bacterium]